MLRKVVSQILSGISVTLIATVAAVAAEPTYSECPDSTGTAQIHQLLSSVQGAIQLADVPGLVSLLVTADSSQLPLSGAIEEQLGLRLCPSGNCFDPNNPIPLFTDFQLSVDSIEVVDELAVVSLAMHWSGFDPNPAATESPHVTFRLVSGRWGFSTSTEVLSLLDRYLAERGTVQSPPPLHDARAKSSSSVFQSYHILNPVDWLNSPRVRRADRSFSHEYLDEQQLFGCPTAVTTFRAVSSPALSHDVIAVSDLCWRRMVVTDLHSDHSYIVSRGHVGSAPTLDDFSQPQGLEFMGPGLIYVTEDYNNRVKVVEVNAAGNDKLYLYNIITLPELNRPVDLDVTLPNEFGERTVIVANSAANNILLFDDEEPWGAHNVRIRAGGGSVGALINPISVAFGRDPLTSVKNNLAYLIDSGGKRIVRIQNWNNTTPGYTAYSDFPDPHTNLSCIAVDNKGEVWAVDKGLGKIYKFTKDLVPIAKHGYLGTADGEYLHPTSISFTQGWDYNTGQPLSNLGEVVLAEEWTDDTGIRRLVPGTEIFDETIVFRPKLSSSLAAVHGGYFITGYSNITEELIDPSGNTVDSHQRLMVASGQQSYWFYLSPSLPSGTYQLRVTAASIYTNSNTDITTMSVAVDNSLVNQPPVVTNIWFPDGDSCFIMDVPKWIRATAYDPDGSISTYQWQVTEAGSGEIYYIHGDSLFFQSHYTNAKAPGDDSYLQIKAVDNYGEASASAHFLKFSKLTFYYDYDCICTWMPGDADFSHAYSISDIVYLVNFQFAGGPPPQPVLLAGDADCSQSVSISDAVFLTNYLFAGGPPVQCTCSDY